jgi:hypothetical protein
MVVKHLTKACQSKYLVKDIERIRERAMGMIFLALSYDESLSVAELVNLDVER